MSPPFLWDVSPVFEHTASLSWMYPPSLRSPGSPSASSVTKSRRRSSDMGLGFQHPATEIGKLMACHLIDMSIIHPLKKGLIWGYTWTYPFRQNFLMFFNASLQAANRPTLLIVKMCPKESTYQSTRIPATQTKLFFPQNLTTKKPWSHVFEGHFLWSNNCDKIRLSVESGAGMSRGSSAKSYTPPTRPAWAETTTRLVCTHNRHRHKPVRNKVDQR